MKLVKPKIFEPIIGKESKDKRPLTDAKKTEIANDPGKYAANLNPFGSKMSKVTMGSKVEFKPDKNPPVGGYDIDAGDKLTSFRNRSIVPFDKKPVSPKKQGRNPYGNDLPVGPDPGDYQKEVITFGSEVKTKVNFGNPHKFKAD